MTDRSVSACVPATVNALLKLFWRRSPTRFIFYAQWFYRYHYIYFAVGFQHPVVKKNWRHLRITEETRDRHNWSRVFSCRVSNHTWSQNNQLSIVWTQNKVIYIGLHNFALLRGTSSPQLKTTFRLGQLRLSPPQDNNRTIGTNRTSTAMCGRKLDQKLCKTETKMTDASALKH